MPFQELCSPTFNHTRLVALAFFFVVCGALAFFNALIFAPVLMLLGWFSDRGAKSRQLTFNEHVD